MLRSLSIIAGSLLLLVFLLMSLLFCFVAFPILRVCGVDALQEIMMEMYFSLAVWCVSLHHAFFSQCSWIFSMTRTLSPQVVSLDRVLRLHFCLADPADSLEKDFCPVLDGFRQGAGFLIFQFLKFFLEFSQRRNPSSLSCKVAPCHKFSTLFECGTCDFPIRRSVSFPVLNFVGKGASKKRRQ